MSNAIRNREVENGPATGKRTGRRPGHPDVPRKRRRHPAQACAKAEPSANRLRRINEELDLLTAAALEEALANFEPVRNEERKGA